MLLYCPPPSSLPAAPAPPSNLPPRPRLALDTRPRDSAILDTHHFDHLRPAKRYDYRPTPDISSSSSSSSWAYHQDSSLASPKLARYPRHPLSFPQPSSAPHNQLSHQYPPRYASDRSSYPDSSSADRRMSEPAVVSGNHPTAYRLNPSVDQHSRHPYSTYSPPDLQHQSRTEHSRNGSTGSTVGHTYDSDSRTHWSTNGSVKQEDSYPDTSPVISFNYSPRPSTGSGSTGVESTSPLPTYSVHAPSSISAGSTSPDLPPISTHHPADLSLQGDYSSSSPSNSNKTYAFVSLPGTTIRKRPRRRYDEIERLYHCSWPECTKAYGTLNHLNAHVVMQKHGPRRLPAEFKELRKQWRKAKKEGAFTPPSSNSAHLCPSPPSSSSSQCAPHNSYYLDSSPASTNERKRRMTDPNPPPVSSYRPSNSYGHNMHPPSNLASSSWAEDSGRRYAVSMAYQPSENAGAEEVYGTYHDVHPVSQTDETLAGFRQISPSANIVHQGYSINSHGNEDHFGQGYSYPLSPPAVGQSSQQQDVLPSVSPSSSSHHRYGNTLPPISSSAAGLSRLPDGSAALLTPVHDYRTSIDVDGQDGATPGSRSTGSEYDEPRTSYNLHPQQQNNTYYDYENDGDTAAGPYSLGRNRLPRDSTLLTPLNLEHLRYTGKGV